MTEMIERVAKALYDNACLAVPSISVDFDGAHPETQDAMRHQARAAIVAMREPTEEMVALGMMAGDGPNFADPDETWRIMIDAALK